MRGKTLPIWPVLVLCSSAGALLVLSQSWGSTLLGAAGGNEGRPYPIRFELPPLQPENPAANAASIPLEATPAPLVADNSLAADPLATTSRQTELAAANGLASAAGAPRRPSGTDRLLALEFDLADPSASSKRNSTQADLEMVKTIRFNGSTTARAKIRVGTDETLSIERTELVGLLKGAGLQDLATRLGVGRELRPYVSFNEIRQQGMNLRYDPVSDQVLLSL